MLSLILSALFFVAAAFDFMGEAATWTIWGFVNLAIGLAFTVGSRS